MQVIQVTEDASGAAFVLVSQSGSAQLMIVGATSLGEHEYADMWDQAVRFAWSCGWAPRRDDADLYVAAIDTEWYALMEIDREEVEIDVRDGEASIG